MSRLQKVFEERLDNASDEENLIRLIYKNCQPYLKQALKDKRYPLFIFSGRNYKGDWFKGKVRTDRRPTDTNLELHNDLNKEFVKKFGYPVRSASIFCSGDQGVAESYGDSYFIFPIGNFKFVWSPDISDLFLHIRDEYGANSRNINGIHTAMTDEFFRHSNDIEDEFAKYHDEWSEEGGPNGYWVYEGDVDGDIRVPKGKTHLQAVAYVKERVDDYSVFSMVWYPDLDFDGFRQKYFKEWDAKRLEKVNSMIDKRYEYEIENLVMMYTDKDFEAAVSSMHEIMLNCKQYYAVYDDNYHLLKDAFLEYGMKGPR